MMTEFIVEEYYEKYQKKTYLDVFFDFLKNKFESDKIYIEYFTLVNEADLLESLDYFILIRKVTARRTASTYIGKLKILFGDLENQYGVKNGIFVNGNFLPGFQEKVNNKVSVLREKIDKSLASDKQYDALINEITEFEKKYSYEDAIIGIDKYLTEKNVKSDELRMFRLLCSICATQMVIEYGLKNNVIRDIKLKDIDLEKGIINRAKHVLPLSATLKKNLERYLKVREYILWKTNKEQDWLFVSFNGDAFCEKKDFAANLFYILGVLNDGSVETDPFARRTLIEMIEKGFNAILISEITGYKDTVYENVCNIVNANEEQIQRKLENFVNQEEQQKVKIEKKGYINCPMCGKSVKAVSSELVLIKKRNDDMLYLACKNCGGHNG